MARGTAEGTPLGYGVSVLPESTFDATKFGEQVAAERKAEKAATKKQAEKDKDEALKAIDYDYGKLDWIAPQVEHYDKLIKGHRENLTQLYLKQNGKLTTQQLLNDKKFKRKLSSEYNLLNKSYEEFTKLREDIRKKPEIWDTPENREILNKLENPYQNDKAAFKKYDNNILNYLAGTNYLNKIKPKSKGIDTASRIAKYISNTKTQVPTFTTDPKTGKRYIKTRQGFDKARFLDAARLDYENTPYLQEKYETADDWAEEALKGAQQDIVGLKGTGGEVNITTGGTTHTKNVKVTPDDKGLRVLKTKKDDKISLKPSPVLSEQEVEEEEQKRKQPGVKDVKPEDIAFGGYSVSDDNGKPLEITTHVNYLEFLTSDGQIKRINVNKILTQKVNSVRNLQRISRDFKVSEIKNRAIRKLLQKYGYKGTLKAGTTLPKQITDQAEGTVLAEALQDRWKTIGDITEISEILKQVKDTDLEKYIDIKTGSFKRGLVNSFMLDYGETNSALTNSGFTLNEYKKEEPEVKVKPDQPNYLGKDVIYRGGYKYTWNEEKGTYE